MATKHPSALNVITGQKSTTTIELHISIPKQELVESEEENITPTLDDYHHKEYQFSSYSILKEFVEKIAEDFDYIHLVQFYYKRFACCNVSCLLVFTLF